MRCLEAALLPATWCEGGCLRWRPPFIAVPPCLLGGAGPLLPLIHPPIILGGAPPATVGTGSYTREGLRPPIVLWPPLRSTYLVSWLCARCLPLHPWPCKGQTLLSLLASQPCVAWGLIWVLLATKLRRVWHFHSRHSLFMLCQDTRSWYTTEVPDPLVITSFPSYRWGNMFYLNPILFFLARSGFQICVLHRVRYYLSGYLSFQGSLRE